MKHGEEEGSKMLLLFTFVTTKKEMTYISIDTNKKQAQQFLEYVKTLPFVKIHQQPNTTTRKAMAAAKKGKTTKHTSTKTLVSFLNK